MRVKTIQEWIKYAQEIESTCNQGEEVYDKELVAISDLKKWLETKKETPELQELWNRVNI